MILGIFEYIRIGFGYLLDWLYQFSNNYGLALILFSVIVKLVLMPTTIKGKRSTMKMSRLTPRLKYIQKKYENDQMKQSEEIRKLYKEEGVSMGGGCLWSLLPLLILIPLYQVIREPLTYILHQTDAVTKELIELVRVDHEAAFKGLDYYKQMVTAAHLHDIDPTVIAGIQGITDAGRVASGVNFSFLGINLAGVPEYNIFSKTLWSWDWAHIGGFLLPVLSAGSQMLTMLISQRANNSLITDAKGVQDSETAKESQAGKSGKVMMYVMPIMTIFIGFSMPAAMSLYWLIQGVVGTVMDIAITKSLRKDYDAEDALRLQKAMEAELAELEKERIRAERRAANPDGITENTSKKKLQQKQQREQDAQKAAAKKEYNAKRGIVEEEEEEEQVMSGIPDRPFCKGRNYDPTRYASQETEEEK